MDPDQTLAEIHYYLNEAQASGNLSEENQNLVQASQLFEALDDWISNGGFLPRLWTERGRPVDTDTRCEHGDCYGARCNRTGWEGVTTSKNTVQAGSYRATNTTG